jgi:hypothetical protein
LLSAQSKEYLGIDMHRISGVLLFGSRVFAAIVVPCCYWLAGLLFLLHDFTWYATVATGIFHLFIFLVVQRLVNAYYKPVLFFVCFLFVGIATFFAAWIVWEPNTDVSFPLALVGNIAWSIVSWECTTYLHLFRLRQDVPPANGSAVISRTDQLLVLTTPMIFAGCFGAIFAVTNPDSRFLGDRVEDFFNVAQLGVACGLFLAIPWFCLPIGLKFWRRECQK